MAVLAVGVALFSLRFAGAPAQVWLGIDPDIRRVVVAHPVEALTLMLVAPVALLLGPWQFVPGLRARHPAFHRWSGRIYVAACVVAGVGGLATAFHASGGPVAGFGFGLLAVLWIGATLGAWRAARAGRFLVQIPVGFALGYRSYSAMSVWLASTAWVPNVIVVALYSTWTGARRRGAMAAV